MDILTRATVTALIDGAAAPSVSIYMPTHRAGNERAQDPLLLKNLVAEARSEKDE